MATPEGKKAGRLVTSNYTSDAGALNYLQGVLHDDLAEKFKEIMTGKGKLTASDFDDILPQLTAKLEPDKHSMSDVLSPNDLRILGLVLPQGHLDRLKLIGLNIEDKSLGELTKEKVADALKDIGQAHLAKVLSDKEGIQKLQSEIYQTVYIRALKDPKSFTVNLQLFRMCLFGVPRSGKTTFWNRLVNDDFDTDKLSQSTPLAEQHHIHVSQASMDMVMLYNWHLCSDDGSSKSKNEIDKEALVIYNRILKSCNISASMNRDAPPTPSDSAEVAHHSKRDDLVSEEVKVKDASPSIQETNVRVSLPQPVVNDEIFQKIDSIFKKLQKSLTSVGEVPDVSSLRQLINLSDVGGQRAFLELLPILTTGSALYLIFFSYANSLTEPLRDIYQGSEKCFNLANEYSQIEVIMQSLRCVATSSSSEDDLSKEDSGAKVTALLVGTHTDKRSDHNSIKKDNEDIRSNVKGFLDSNKSILEYANVKQEDLVLEVNNKTKHKEEFDKCKEVLMRVALGKFSRNEKQLPGSWLMFMIMLRKMKLAKHSVLQYDHCKYIASKLFIPADEASMNGLLHFMHKDLGILMYFPEVPCLKHLVICDPAVVFTAISEIIIPSFTNDAVTVTDKAFLHFKKHGVFAYQTIDDLTKKKEDFLESKRLVPLLQHLGVIAPIQFSDQDSKSGKKFECQLDHDCVQDSQHCIHAEYIIPCVIKGTTSAEAEAIDQHCSKNCMIAPLKIAFECKFAPMGGFCYLFTKLLTEKSSDWKPYLPEIHVPDSKCPINRLLRRNKVTFLVDQKFFVTFVASTTDFKVFIVRGDSNDQTGYEFVCHKVRNAIKNALSTCPNHQVRNFKTAFRCNGHTRGYRHDEHLMIVNQKSINSAKITAVCDEEKRKVDIDPDDLSIMVWFKGPFKLVKEPLSDLRKPFRGEFKLTVSTTRAMCNFQWKRIGHDLKLSDPLCVGVHSPTLHFKCFCKAYEGAYICTITDPTKQLQSESLSANLMLDAPKEFDKEMTTEDFYAYLNGQGMSLGDCNKIRDLVITEKNFSADCIPSGISDDGKMKFKEVLKDLKPKITEQSESLSKYCGEEAELRVIAEGSGKIRYQWQKNGKNIADGKVYQGATNHTLTMNPLQSRHAGQYSCFIENDYGTAVSKQVELALNIKIIEQTQPCLSSHFSEEVILYVSATGQVGLEYQWKKDGKDIHDHDYKCAYIGTNTDKLKITSMSDKLQGIYQCVVSNAMDFVESGEISLTMEMKQRLDDLSLTSKPTLWELTRIESGDEKTSIRIIDNVAHEWKQVATSLQFELHHIKRIETDYRWCKDACQAVFSDWLDGCGREPRTWSTIIKALNEAHFGEVAGKLNNIVTKKN